MSSTWRLDALTHTELTDLATAAVTTLAGREYAALDNLARLDLLAAFERLTRALPGIGHELINQLGQQNAAEQLQARKLHILLSQRLRIPSAEAKRRIAHAAELGPGLTLAGQPLPGPHADTGQAQRDGDIGADHADVIVKLFGRLPADIPSDDLDKAEAHLIALAKKDHADSVKVAAARIEAHLNPDGDEPADADPDNGTYFRMKPQGKDKLTRGDFRVDAETRAYMEAYFAKTDFASGYPFFDRIDLGGPTPTSDATADPSTGPGTAHGPRTPEQQGLFDYFAEHSASAASDTAAEPAPDVTEPTEPAEPSEPRDPAAPPDPTAPPPPVDRRPLAQRRADAIKSLLRAGLGSPALGQHNGLPVTAIITMTLKELEAASGHALTGGGSLIPMRQAIAMAANAHHYLLIYDDDGRALHLGRAKRLASADQRLVLHATDRGCTFPACTRPGHACQTHHTDEWADGGHTDIHSLTFACPEHHSLVGPGEHDWTTTIAAPGTAYAGRTIWHPPTCVDPLRRGRINHHHHPDEYLQPPAEFPGPPGHPPSPRPGSGPPPPARE